MDEVDDLLYGIIRDRRASSEEYDDLMAMLLAARDEATGEGMDDKQLRDEIITIFGAGHDTTANALSWVWYLLSMHPEVLKQLQDEVDTVLGDRSPTAADLPNLPYTLQVFEEAMRLYPPSPAVPREALEQTTIGGYHVPDGAKVLLNIISIHRNPAFWPEPDKFKPERFAPGVNEKRHRFAFMPFGGGPRQCIGNNFALMEGHLLLALMAQHVELKLVPGQDVKREIAITMRPRHGLQVTYHPRQK
jgi:cytochrome P450